MKNTWKTIILVILFLWLISFFTSKILEGNFVNLSPGNKIALIPIFGAITSNNNFLYDRTIDSNNILEKIKETESNTKIKGVIFEINSPGGEVVASAELAEAIKKMKKPKVALIRDVGASGAYWVASAADAIVAHPMSVTGSIGVTSSYLEFSSLMEKYGVGYVPLKTGEFKDTGSPFKKLSEDERSLLEGKLNLIHEYFVSELAKNRNLDKKTLDELANGIFYLGVEAKELGLVDYLGDRDVAFNIAKELANIEEAKIVKFKEKEGLFELLKKVSAYSSFFIGKGIGSSFYDNLKFQSFLDFSI